MIAGCQDRQRIHLPYSNPFSLNQRGAIDEGFHHALL
ncbi:Uncharacterised protein [Vibrio cholerae]|nr:Uncharacterised protein [Vibrio cholerae]CSI50344.1 Uncharacterised protein [Vibrio cholerae]